MGVTTLLAMLTPALLLSAICLTQGLVEISWEIGLKAIDKCVVVGDEVVFHWEGSNHNVNQVFSEEDYLNCKGITNIGGETGPKSFPLNKVGDYYFVCGVEGHCQHGNQKARLRVHKRCDPGKNRGRKNFGSKRG